MLTRDGFETARRAVAQWPGYAPTPLAALPGLAASLGLGRLWYKDEAFRFGLGSFKALGGPYALLRQVRAVLGRAGIPEADTGVADLVARRHEMLTRGLTVTTATDGNHGRAVAWGAALFGCRCVVFVHERVSAGRVEAIAAFGAEVRRVPGTYDDSVRRAAREAAERGWVVISDISYPGYVDIPRDVMHGYGVMQDEVAAQLPAGEPPPTHVLVHAGVGAWAASLCARQWQFWGDRRPRFIVVEPAKADCLFRSAGAGRPVAVEGELDTVMAGLACGEPSLLAWEVLSAGADDFMTIDDEWALAAMRRLAEGTGGDAPRVAGETGAAGLAGLLAAHADGAAWRALGLGPESRVLVFGSEGDTDPAIYREVVGRPAEAVRAGRNDAPASAPRFDP